MVTTTVLQSGSISVLDYRCSAGPADRPFVELHDGFSVSYVRKGNFGYRFRGESFELVAGSILVGYPGDEFMCTHDHHVCGDECLSFQLVPSLVEAIGQGTEKWLAGIWRAGALPPLPELMVLGELAQAAADGTSDVGLDELGMLLVSGFVEAMSGRKRNSAGSPGVRPPPCGGRGALDRRELAPADRSRERSDTSRAEPVSLPATVRESPRRDAAPVSGSLAAAPCGAPAGRRRSFDHRRRLRRRLCRPLQLRTHVSSRSRRFASTLPSGSEGRPQDFPSPARRCRLG